MSANLENSAVAMGLEKVNFHSNLKERQCQRVFKLLHNCTHFTCQQSNAQNPSSQVPIVYEPRNSKCTSWIQKRERNQRSNCQHPLDHKKAREFQKNIHSCLLIMPKPLTVQITTNWKILKEMGIPDHLTCLLRNLYTGQEATVRIRHGTDWFQIGKGVHQGCIMSPCLFNLYAVYIMRNAGLDEAQAGIKVEGCIADLQSGHWT